MKIVVIGGTGLIGSRFVAELRELGHETVTPYLGAHDDSREVVADPHARYFGAGPVSKTGPANQRPRRDGFRRRHWQAVPLAERKGGAW